MKEIQQVINTHVTDRNIETKVNIENDNKILLISISGISDMEIHFKNKISEKTS